MRAALLFAAAFSVLSLGAEARAEGPADELAQSLRDPCWDTFECRQNGRCTTEGDACVAGSQELCAASNACREDGVRCILDADAGRCVSRLGQKVDSATTKKTAPPPGNEPYLPGRGPGNPVQEAGLALTILGGLGLLVGLGAAGLSEVWPEGETKDTLLIVGLSGSIPGAALTIPGVIMIHYRDDGPVTASVGPGRFRITF